MLLYKVGRCCAKAFVLIYKEVVTMLCKGDQNKCHVLERGMTIGDQ